MNRLRPVLLVAAVTLAGAVGTLLVASLMGMPGDEVWHLAAFLLPGIGATVVATAAAVPLLRRSSMRARMVVIAVVSAGVALMNLFVLTRLMFLSEHDASLVGILLAYSAAAGIGAAVALARSSRVAVEHLLEASRRIADGDLDVRVGGVPAGRELDELARTFDDMVIRLRRSIERERSVERMRRDLFGAVSHDLRTPLSGLRAMIEAIDDGVVDRPDDLRRYVSQMKVTVHSIGDLVNDLFELVELDEGAIETDRDRVLLQDVVHSAIAACEAQALQKDLRVSTQLNGAGATQCSPRMVRVLQNLLQNAIRHTPSDGTITLSARGDRDVTHITVVDSGEGIDPGALERIFDPFWRADPARTGGSSGLGLALAKRLVERLGGEISAESRPGAGATFTIRVPSRPSGAS
jgi:signal transduction histidine kinase